jgi:hypothetical protein
MKASAMVGVSILAGALAIPLAAETTAAIEGSVLDALTQKPVADAVVIAQSPSLQAEQTTLSDRVGRFTIALLPVGTYRLTVQREGYQPFTEQGPFTLRPGQTIEVQLFIVPESIPAGEVVISAAKPAIDVGSVQSGGTVNKEQMDLVPYGRTQRDFQSAATSIPGVFEDRYGLAMRGSGSPEGNYVIDGVNATDPLVGTLGMKLLQDFIQEIEVKTGGYQAEYGRASGGIINVVTKSGGNDVHGSVFFNWSPFELPRRRLIFGGTTIAGEETQRYSLDFGAEIGGPIVRDRLWFFFGAAPQLNALYEDRLIQARIDDGTGAPLLDGNGVPVLREVARKRYLQTETSLQFASKLTWLVSQDHTLALAAFGNPTRSSGARGAFGGNEGAFLWEERTGSTAVSLRYGGKLLRKTLLVEGTVGYYRQEGSPQLANAQPIAIGDLSADLLRDTPRINWTRTRNLLDPAFQDATTPDYQRDLQACRIQANGFDPCPVTGYSTGGIGFRLTEQTLERASAALKLTNFFDLGGHHQLKYGMDGALDRYSRRLGWSGGARANEDPGSGEFDIHRFGNEDPSHPGFPAFDSFRPGHLLGERPDSLTRNGSFSFFAQDTWSVRDRLVLDLGVRGEKQLMYVDRSMQDAQGNPIKGAQLGLFNLMPRAGLLYDFTGQGLSKVYTSFGRFYEFIPLDIALFLSDGQGASVQYRSNPSSCAPPPGSVVRQDPRFCAVIVPQSGQPYQFYGRLPGTAVDPRLEGQYVDELQLGAQYQIVRDVVLGIDYAHRTTGRVVEDMSADEGMTFFISNPGEPGKLGYQATTGDGITVRFPRPRRVYDALTLSVRKSFSQNYLFSASYTYSSLRGNYPGLFNTDSLDPNQTSDFDLVSLLPNRDGPLPDDVPNSFKVDGAYVLELSPRMALQLGGNLRAEQGKPINYLGAHPGYGAGEIFILPRGSGGRLPWLWQINVRLAATYRLGPPYIVKLSLDVFNLTNNRAAIAVDENYTLDIVNPIVNGSIRDLASLKNANGLPATVNPSFRNPTAYQLPLSVRMGARLSF